MGQVIIGHGQINVGEKDNERVLSKFKECMKFNGQFISVDDQNLDFEIEGNNYLEYNILDKFISWAKKEKIPLSVSVSEYIAIEGGYFEEVTSEGK